MTLHTINTEHQGKSIAEKMESDFRKMFQEPDEDEFLRSIAAFEEDVAAEHRVTLQELLEG